EVGMTDDHQPGQPRGHAREGDAEERRQHEDAGAETGDPQRKEASTRAWFTAASPLPPATNSRAIRICACAGTVSPSWRARVSTRAGERRVATSTSSWFTRVSTLARFARSSSSWYARCTC